MLIARAREDGGFTLPVVLLMVLAAFAVYAAHDRKIALVRKANQVRPRTLF